MNPFCWKPLILLGFSSDLRLPKNGDSAKIILTFFGHLGCASRDRFEAKILRQKRSLQESLIACKQR
jgi:hypothetical protein